MTTKEFIEALQSAKGKELLLEYAAGKLVPRNYHLTEIKNIKVQSVDCGGKANKWTETVIQIHTIPTDLPTVKAMSTEKALSILNKVDELEPIDRDAPVRFEYRESNNPLAIYELETVSEGDGVLMVKFAGAVSQCKAGSGCC